VLSEVHDLWVSRERRVELTRCLSAVAELLVFVPGNESSKAFSLPGAKVRWNFRSRSESSWERKFLLPLRISTQAWRPKVTTWSVVSICNKPIQAWSWKTHARVFFDSFLPRDAQISAKRGIADRRNVCPYACLWRWWIRTTILKSWKLIARTVRPTPSIL